MATAVPHRYCNCVERHVEKRWPKPQHVVRGDRPLVEAVGVDDKDRQRSRHTKSEQRQQDKPSPDVRTSVRGSAAQSTANRLSSPMTTARCASKRRRALLLSPSIVTDCQFCFRRTTGLYRQRAVAGRARGESPRVESLLEVG